MVIEELAQTVRNELAVIISEYNEQTGQELSFEICTSRDIIERSQTLHEDSPRDRPDINKLFFVITAEKGQRNFAAEEAPITIQCLSMEDTIIGAYDIMASFVATYSYTDTDGYIQVYFTPTVMSASSQVFTGFRALCSVSGVVTLVDSSLLMFDEVIFYNGSDPLRLPFINIGYSYQASSDPRAFSEEQDANGSSESLNTTNVKTVSIVTYMWNFKTSETSKTTFSQMVMEAINGNMNKKFHILLHTNLSDDSSNDNPWIDDWYVLKSASMQQEYFKPSPWALVFAKAREKEDGE